ncbi:glycosyltransferase family 2 protein [uncultured Fusobacterium sp.]|uniref:glycosyltransferase family 2 protein n=1 Tax=uncultured Fusobacterium sp. TaxID=159267 RepID=UPI0025F54082|nr:glycosyltransferase family 2 protein [uncultured Fusobacterium sp.]
MDVSIIIVNYNTLNLTKNAIDSVLEKTEGISYEIILVDNDSVDGSVEFFEKNYKDKIILVKNKENLGFGRANNKGIEKAKGKYIFLLNSDTLLINNAIKILYDFMEENEKCGICGGNLYNKDLSPTDSFSNSTLNYKTLYWDKILKKLNFFSKKLKSFNYTIFPKKVQVIIGADMMLSRKLLSEIKGFDVDFFMYHEENELCVRALKKGYEIYSVPAAKIIHLEGKSSKFKEKRFILEKEGTYTFFYKVRGYKSLKWAYFLLQLSYISQFNFYKLNLNKKVYRKMKQKYEEGKKI